VSVRASSANPWDWHFIRGEPVLLRPAGLGGVRKPKFAVPGGDLAGPWSGPAAPSRPSSRAMRHPMRLSCQAAWGSFFGVLGKAVSSS
jgi:hypothetical protein